MRKLAFRRLRNTLAMLGLAILVVSLPMVLTTAHRDTARTSGWSLLLMIAILALYNVRKKLSVLPLGSASTWLQFHIYTGWLTAFVFGVHVGWRFPNGLFECLLGSVYAGVFLSGVFGLAVSRSFARRLTTRGDEVIYERIPVFRNRLATRMEGIVLECLEQTESTAVANYYTERLQPYFSRSCHLWHHLMQSDRPRRTLLSEIESQQRYLNDIEKQTMRKIAECVKRKDDLDYQFALQATLKYWLFLHVPLTYVLLVFTLFHLLLVLAFSGGGA